MNLRPSYSAAAETLSASPMIGMSARGLLVHDLKAAGALPSSAVTEAHCLGPHTIMLALPCMHHALSESRSQTFSADTRTDMNPSTTRAGSLPDAVQHRPRCATVALRSESSAEAPEQAASASHRVCAAVLRQHSGHSGAMPAAMIGQSHRPVACSTLDDRTPGARAEGKVVYNVILTL